MQRKMGNQLNIMQSARVLGWRIELRVYITTTGSTFNSYNEDNYS